MMLSMMSLSGGASLWLYAAERRMNLLIVCSRSKSPRQRIRGVLHENLWDLYERG